MVYPRYPIQLSDNNNLDKRRMCPQCRAFITTDDKVCPYCDTKLGARAIDLRVPDQLLGGLLPSDRFVTMLLLMINSAMFMVTVLVSMQAGNGRGGFDPDGQTLIEFGASYPPYVVLGQWWRRITAGFLHGGLLHIGMNSLALFRIGPVLEQVFGSSRITAIYIVSTYTGFALSSWRGNFSVGASAGIFGLVGAGIALGTLNRRSAEAQMMKDQFVQMAVMTLALGLMGGFMNMDNWAHLGGLAGGFGMAMFSGTDRQDGQRSDRLWNYIAVACLLLTAYCFLQLVLWHMSLPAR